MICTANNRYALYMASKIGGKFCVCSVSGTKTVIVHLARDYSTVLKVGAEAQSCFTIVYANVLLLYLKHAYE